MKLFKVCALVFMAAGLSACATFETATRGTPSAAPVISSDVTVRSADWKVVDVRVEVPETLSTTEANMYYPNANVIWRGEPYGNRHAQVSALMDAALTRGLVHLNGAQDVYFDVTVRRFHSVTEKARAVIGGVHDMIFVLTVRDAETGVALHGPEFVETNIKAYGGRRALQAEREGLSQKVRVQSHLAGLMQKSFPNAFLLQQAALNARR